MIILAIETSCDDTGVAILETKNGDFKILSNVISSQIDIHKQYGGVVPNLAARAHLNNIKPCLNQALKNLENKSLSKINLIAVTKGPGLIPSLLVGINFAKALAYNWQKPIVEINHIEAHLYANWINPINLNQKLQNKNHKQATNQISFPALCLLISGGHTQLILMKDHSDYKLLGETRDDAAGEAFDKVAKLLKLSYPGGPAISQQAKKWKSKNKNIRLPRPMINSKNYDFSFSGIKTSVLYKIREFKKVTPQIKIEICHEFQQAVIDVLLAKTIKAAKEYKVKNILLSGGVASNQELRRQLAKTIEKELTDVKYHIPDPIYCTDNAAMIAATAYFKQKQKENWEKISADPNLKLID